MQKVRSRSVCLLVFWVTAVTATSASSRELAIESIRPARHQVGRFCKFELDLDVAGDWQNPFDPDQVDITAHFTAPSGKVLRVPAFYYQGYRCSPLPAAEKRRRVNLLKLYINERDWGPHGKVDFFIDDVRLLKLATGEEVLLDDMEDGELRWWPPEMTSWSEEIIHSGGRALKFTPAIDRQESWPGAVLSRDGADWSQFDGLSLWLYPRTSAVGGDVGLYFQDEDYGNSPIMRWGPASGTIQPNRWNHLVWDWRGFMPTLKFDKQGGTSWKVRFTPVEEGRYRYHITAKDGQSATRSEQREFEVIASDRPGFIRVSPRDPHYFAHDNGDLFFPIGHDVIWSGAGGPLDLAFAHFPKMAAHGENCTYQIMHALPSFPPRLAIEWQKLGVYDLAAAAKLDWYLDLGEKHGIYFKLSFDVHAHNIADEPGHGLWHENPYNAERGGPCARPNEFYTNRHALESYKKRLRYIVARWGYSPYVMAWEAFAEIDGATELDGRAGWGYPTKAGGERISAMLVEWLRETTAYLRRMDPYDHLISISFGGDVSDPRIWEMPEIEYTQIHHYNSRDTAKPIADWCRRLTEDYAKPMMVTEFGWGTRGVDNSVDPEGICLHNGMWASVMSGAAGAAMTWWCRRVEELNLYPHFQALRNFVRGIEWPNERFQPATVEVRTPQQANLPSVTITARGPFSGAEVSEFTVHNDGSVNEPGQVAAFLLAPGRPEPRALPTFHVTYPVDGTFAVHVDSVSPDARLDVYLDDRLALRQELPAQDVEGKSCTLSERWQVWQCTYDEDFAVSVPAGPHTIRLENGKPGFSWIRISHYTLTNYDPRPLRVVGLTGRRTTLLWIQNKESTWGNDVRGLEPHVISGAKLTVDDLKQGEYRVEWWDTYSGTIAAAETVAAGAGRIEIDVPPLRRDVACKIIGKEP